MSNEPPQTPQPQHPPMQPIHPGYPNQQQPYPPYLPYPAPLQPYPPHPPRPPRASNNPLRPAFWRNMSTLKIVIVTVVSTVLLATVVMAFLALTLSNPPQFRHIIIPLDAPTTPTRPPQPISGATLGGTPDAFFAKYGNPVVLPSFSLRRNWFPFKLPNGTTAHVCYCEGAPGSDGNSRLDDFHIAPPSGTTWSDQQSISIARQFFPPDARYVRDFTDRYTGLIHIYMSAALAATFPASEFHAYTGSGNTQLAPPGTFSIVCGRHDPAPCEVFTGY